MEDGDIFCPLVDEYIYDCDCDENLLGAATPETMKEWYGPQYKTKENWIEICRSCKEFKEAYGDID